MTPARRVEHVVCVRIQSRFGPQEAATGLIAVRGSQEFSLDGVISIGQLRLTIHPSAPALIGDAGSLNSSGSDTATVEAQGPDGSFSGPVTGTYRMDVLGFRRFSVGGLKLRALGLQLRSAYKGQGVAGTQESVQWVSLQHRLLVAQTVWSEQAVGSRIVHLNYRSILRAPQPALHR